MCRSESSKLERTPAMSACNRSSTRSILCSSRSLCWSRSRLVATSAQPTGGSSSIMVLAPFSPTDRATSPRRATSRLTDPRYSRAVTLGGGFLPARPLSEVGGDSLQYRVGHRPCVGVQLRRVGQYKTRQITAPGHHPGQAMVYLDVEDRQEDALRWNRLKSGADADHPTPPLGEPDRDSRSGRGDRSTGCRRPGRCSRRTGRAAPASLPTGRPSGSPLKGLSSEPAMVLPGGAPRLYPCLDECLPDGVTSGQPGGEYHHVIPIGNRRFHPIQGGDRFGVIGVSAQPANELLDKCTSS
jgi:hypothetical protein